MSNFFLSQAFLFALPLAAIPIALHFFDRRRKVVIEWGAMQFLQEAAARRTSARRLQQWLLLLLRVLLIAALVAALAQPLLPGHWLGATQRRETILVIDNSLSTMRNSADASLFDGMIKQAQVTLDEIPSGDAVRIMLASPYPVWVNPASVRVDIGSRPELREQIGALRPTQGSSDLLSALLKAVQSDLEDKTLNERRVILMTDGQGTDWKTSDEAGWKQFRGVLANTHVPTLIDIVEPNASDVTTDNIAVGGVRSSRAVVGINQTFTVTAQVQNLALDTSEPADLVWSVAGDPHEDTLVPTLEAGAIYDASWHCSFDRAGVYTVSCAISADDDLQADNDASVVVEVVDRIPVLLIEGSTGFAEIQQDAWLVQAALGRIEGQDAQGWQAVFAPRTIPPRRLETIDLDQFRAVVIPNLTDLSREAVDRLSEFVFDGGGLWIALGPRTEISEFNRLLFNQGDGLSPVGLDRIVDEPGGPQGTTINPFVKQHPATLVLTDDDKLDTGEVRVSRRMRFQMPGADTGVSVLLDLTTGDPLVVENAFGAGRVIVQGVPLRMQWSKLAMSQAFVVMVRDWLRYLSAPGATRHNLEPGDPISVVVNNTRFADATLTTPAGEDITLTGEPIDDGVEFRTSRTILPGTYSLEFGLSGDGIPFHVARDANESNLTQLTATDRRFLAETAGLGPDAEETDQTGSAQSEPVWPLLLMLLIAMLAGELVLSGIIARNRFGTDAIEETTEHWSNEAPLFGNISAMNQRNPFASSSDSSRESEQQPNELVS